MIVNRTRSIFHSYKLKFRTPLEPLERPTEAQDRESCEVVFKPPRVPDSPRNNWKNAQEEFESKLKWAEVIININPFNDYDAGASPLPLALYAASNGIPFVMVVPEEKLIPLPYLKELKNLKEACKNIKSIHFFHSDEEGIEAAIEEIIGKLEKIVFVEADFPHTTSTIKSKQPLVSAAADITPDYNLESIYDCLSKRLADKEFYYLVVEHHFNTSAGDRFKNNNIKNGLFVNDPPTGACWLLMQQLMQDINVEEPNQSNPLKPLWDIHRRFAISSIVTDFYINCLNGQLNESSQLMIENGALEFPLVNELIELIKINPHLVNLIWSDRRDRRQIQSLIRDNNLPKLHFLLAQRLHDEGKQMILQNDSQVEGEMNQVIDGLCVLNDSLNTTLNYKNLRLSFISPIVKSFEQIVNSLQAFDDEESPFVFLDVVKDYIGIGEAPFSNVPPYVVVDKESYLGKLLMEAFTTTDLAMDDLRRLVSSSAMKIIEILGGNSQLTIAFPLSESAYAIIAKSNNTNSINLAQALRKSNGLVGQGGGNTVSSTYFVPDASAEKIKQSLEEIFNSSPGLTTVSL